MGGSFYDAALGRFVTRGSGLNGYATDNNPLSDVDWLGATATTVDVLGYIPGLNTVSGLTTAGIAAYRGDAVGVGAGLLSVIPFAKLGVKAIRFVREAKSLQAGGKAVGFFGGSAKMQRGFLMLPGGSNKPQIVYRGLAEGEDIANGIYARAPNAIAEPKSHVMGLKSSPFISTTKDMGTAMEKYGQHGAIRIDLSKVNSEILDISQGIGKRGRPYTWPRADKEVLVRSHIPAEAITRIK